MSVCTSVYKCERESVWLVEYECACTCNVSVWCLYGVCMGYVWCLYGVWGLYGGMGVWGNILRNILRLIKFYTSIHSTNWIELATNWIAYISVNCTLYNVYYTVYCTNVHCTLYSVYYILYTVDIIHYIVQINELYIKYIVQCTYLPLHCTMYIIQCKV